MHFRANRCGLFVSCILASFAGDLFAINGGARVPQGQWAGVGRLNSCSAVLVDPRIIVFAGHCGAAHEVVTFGPLIGGASSTELLESCAVHPDSGPGGAFDIGYCVTKRTLPYDTIAIGSRSDMSLPGVISVVGFGESTDDPTFGTKRVAELPVRKLLPGIFTAGGPRVGICSGDSGAPAMVMSGSKPILVGIATGTTATGSTATNCGATLSRFIWIDEAISWVEKASGHRIVPSHSMTKSSPKRGRTSRAFGSLWVVLFGSLALVAGGGVYTAKNSLRRQWSLLAFGACVCAVLWQLRGGVAERGDVVTLRLTLAGSDRFALACAAADEPLGYSCEFAADDVRRRISERARLAPYRTVQGGLFLIPGLFLNDAVAKRSRAPGRFEAVCTARLEKRWDSFKMRWSTEGQWVDGEVAWVALVDSCWIA